MVMPAPQQVTTIEELLALPDDGLRHELLDGEHVVTPAPEVRHQRAVLALADVLRAGVGQRDDVEIFPVAADIRLGPRTLVQPDVFIVQSDPEQRFRDWADAPTPLLAAEVISPSTASYDRGKKRRLYLEAGVEEYWIVDLDARLVERWRTGDERPEIVDGNLTWSLSIGITGELDLPKLFDRID